jgi:hypothetical protein
MKRYILLSLLSVTMFFSSCEKDINIDFPVAPSPYVIEGYIENGQGPFVTVSRGISFINEISNDDFLNLFVDNAKVSLTVNNDTNAIYLKMVKLGNASFYIDTTNLLGQIGNTYHLKVAVDGHIFTSTTQILTPAPLDSIVVKPAPDSRADSDSLVQLTAYFSEPNPLGNYYRLLSKKNNDIIYDVAFNSIYDDAIVNGKAIQFSVIGGKSQFQNNDSADFRQYGYFKKGDIVYVKWASIDKTQYDFWKTFEAQSSSFGNPFSPTVIVKSTFKGAGCLGVWAGYGCTIDTVIIPKN